MEKIWQKILKEVQETGGLLAELHHGGGGEVHGAQ